MSGGADRTVRLWNPYSGKMIKVFNGHSREVRDIIMYFLSFSFSFFFFFFLFLSFCFLFLVVFSFLFFLFGGFPFDNLIFSASFALFYFFRLFSSSQDNHLFVSAGGDRQPLIWDTAECKVVRRMRGHDSVCPMGAGWVGERDGFWK